MTGNDEARIALLAEIEAFLERTDMAAATFGMQAMRDPKFVSDLRNGRNPSARTVARIRAWMKNHEPDTAEVLERAAVMPSDKPPGEPVGKTASAASSATQRDKLKDTSKERSKGQAKGGSTGATGADETGDGTLTPRRRLVSPVVRLFAGLFLLLVAFAAGLWAYPLVVSFADKWIGMTLPAPAGAGWETASATGAVEASEATEQRLESLESDITRLTEQLAEQLAEQQQGTGGNGGAFADAARIEALERELAALAAGVAAVEVGGASAVPAPDLTPLENAIEVVTRRLDDVEEELRRITSLAEAQGERLASAALLFELQQRVLTGKPYTRALAAWSVAQGVAEPAALARHAVEGVPDLEALRARFRADASRAANMPAEATSWRDRINNWWRELVTLRRVDDMAGDAPHARIARAEARLAAGDLEAALDEIDALPASERRIFSEWRASAEARLAALAALEGLYQETLKSLEIQAVGNIGRTNER